MNPHPYLVSVHKVDYFVIPAEAGIQNQLKSLDSRFHGNDGKAIYKQTLISSQLVSNPVQPKSSKNPNIEIPAFAGAASRRQAKQILNSNDQIAKHESFEFCISVI